MMALMTMTFTRLPKGCMRAPSKIKLRAIQNMNTLRMLRNYIHIVRNNNDNLNHALAHLPNETIKTYKTTATTNPHKRTSPQDRSNQIHKLKMQCIKMKETTTNLLVLHQGLQVINNGFVTRHRSFQNLDLLNLYRIRLKTNQ